MSIRSVESKSKNYFNQKYGGVFCISIEQSESVEDELFCLVGYRGQSDVLADFYLSKTDIDTNKEEIDWQMSDLVKYH